ncbi:MAG: hypothetical protein F4039_07365 [Gammaproteobacteria bacterium]|nr:hypothetical protein [Gammaproteobacteria bacterium]
MKIDLNRKTPRKVCAFSLEPGLHVIICQMADCTGLSRSEILNRILLTALTEGEFSSTKLENFEPEGASLPTWFGETEYSKKRPAQQE